jgi:hypothetical protein
MLISDYTIKKVDRETWLRLAPAFQDYNYRQSWDFGVACAERIGGESEHVIIEHSEQGVVSLADVRIKKLPVVGGGIAYINDGPLVLKNGVFDEKIFLDVLTLLQEEFITKRKLTLRISTPFIDNTRNSIFKTIFSNQGFQDLQHGKQTILLDLSLDLDTLRQNLHQKWRSHLNNAEKKNLTIHSGKDISLFHQFTPLLEDLVIKKDFTVGLGIDLYVHVQSQSADSDKYLVLLVEIEGSPIAGYVISCLGNSCVLLLGASDDFGRKLNAAYLLQWEIIKIAKSLGCRWYDLGGIDPVENPGVYRFKHRMGGKDVTVPGPYEKSADGARASLVRTGEKIYAGLKPYLVRS